VRGLLARFIVFCGVFGVMLALVTALGLVR
jgi:hypothetical protein